MKNISFVLYSALLFVFFAAEATAQNITTIAGSNATGDTASALVGFVRPYDVAIDASGNMYITDIYNSVVKKVDAVTNVMTRFAGNGTFGFSGDGGPATAAQLDVPIAVTTDAAGNVYISDRDNYRIRKVSPAGIITTFAGTGVAGLTGDGGAATAAQMAPTDIATDAAGNVYFTDNTYSRIRKISGGIISTVAGTTFGYSGDGGPATAAKIARPTAMTIDNAGNILFFDEWNYRMQKVNTAGIIATIAGNGTLGTGHAGDGGPATNAVVSVNGTGISTDAAGNIYFSTNTCIRKINASGIISIFAGHYFASGPTGDGGLAIDAYFNSVGGLGYDAAGNLYIAEGTNNTIRQINTTGIINTIAGNSLPRYTGDEGPALKAIMEPYSVTTDTASNVYIFDYWNGEVRKIPAGSTTVHRIGGNGLIAYDGDEGYATDASFNRYCTISADRPGNIYVVDQFAHAVRKIGAADGVIHRIAGNPSAGGFTGDGGPATAAKLYEPVAAAVDTSGNVFITDMGNRRVRMINTSGVISTFAGTGVAGFSGDGGMATAAKLLEPRAIAADRLGNLYIGDSCRIRKINSAGIITTIAGTGVYGHSGDGGPAISAQLRLSYDIKIDDTGGIFIADYFTIRHIDTSGIIHTIAGTGIAGYTGDGGPAVLAQLNRPTGVAIDRYHNKYIADWYNHRLRFICNTDTVTSGVTISSSVTTAFCPGTSVMFNSAISNAGPSPTYQWKKNGIDIAGATGSSYTSATLANGDVISCVLTPNNIAPCTENNTVESAGITVTVTPVAPTPVIVNIVQSPSSISFAGETITYTVSYTDAGAAPAFQWYKNGILIAAATTNPYVTNSVMPGDIVTVTVKTTDPCANPDSTQSAITATNLADIGKHSNIVLYPNPSNGIFSISGNFSHGADNAIEITNSLGIVTFRRLLTQNETTYDLKEVLPPGIYFVRITAGSSVSTLKLMIQ